MTRLEQILQDLPRLTAEQRSLIADRIKFLNSAGTVLTMPTVTEQARDDDAADWALDVLLETMQRLGVECPFKPAIKKSSQYAAFRQKVPGIVAWMSRSVKKRNQRRALFAMGVGLLYENMVEMEVAVSARSVMQHIHRLPSVINQAFPDYARAGLLGFIVGDRDVR